MQEKFVPYEFALELKELGFDEECFAVYSEHDKTRVYDESFIKEGLKIQAPTWQDAFDWFDKTYGLFSCFFKANTLLLKENYYVFYITDKNNVELEEVEERYDVILEKAHQEIEGNYVNAELHDKLIFEEKYGFKTVVEARLECIKKLIELVKSK